MVAAAGEALAAEESAEAVEGFTGAGAVGKDALGGEKGAVVVDLLAGEPTEAGVGVGDDGGEGLADLVRDGGGDLTDAHHAGGVFEILLGLMEAGLDEMVVFHVDERAIPTGDCAVGVELGAGADEEAAIVSGGNLDAPLAVEELAGGEALRPGLLEVVALVGMDDFEEGGAAKLAEGAADAVEEVGIAEIDIAVVAGGPDLLGDSLGELAEACLAAGEFGVGAFELDGALEDADFQKVACLADDELCSLAIGGDPADGEGEKDEGDEIWDGDGGNGKGEVWGDEEEGDDDGRGDDGHESGEESAEPGAGHDGTDEQEEEGIGECLLENEGPEGGEEDKEGRDGDGPDGGGKGGAGDGERRIHIHWQ